MRASTVFLSVIFAASVAYIAYDLWYQPWQASRRSAPAAATASSLATRDSNSPAPDPAVAFGAASAAPAAVEPPPTSTPGAENARDAAPAPPNGPTKSFPVERILTDRFGRQVAVRLLARNATEVQFVRTADGSPFQYPLASLSDVDQAFLADFRVTELGPLPPAPKRASTTSAASLQSAQELRLQRERAELEHRIELMRLELQKRDNKSPILSRDQLRQRINDCRNRIIDIEKELREIAFRANAD